MRKRKVVDNVVGIVVENCILDVYVFDGPERVEIDWPYDEWYLNDAGVEFHVKGETIGAGEPPYGCIIDENGNIEEGEFGSLYVENDECLFIAEGAFREEPIRSWYNRGYEEAKKFFGKDEDITEEEIFDFLVHLAKKFGGRVIYISSM